MKEAKYILGKVGINWNENSLSFKPNSFSNEISIEISSITNIFIEKANISIIRKLAFWINRIVFFNISERLSLFDSTIDYRYIHDFVIETKTGEVFRKQIKDYSVSKMNKSIAILLEANK